MKVLQIINSFKVGGAERLMAELIPILNESHDMEVLVMQSLDTVFERKLKDSGVKIHCLGVKHMYNPITILKIRRFLKQNPQFDVLHVHLFPVLYWVALASVGMKAKLVWTEHSTSNRRANKLIFRYVERWIYSFYDKIICISDATSRALCGRLRMKSSGDRICVVENGINTRRFLRMKVNKKYPFTLIQISRFEGQKDQDTLIRAMALLPDDIHAVFVGDGFRLQICKELSVKIGVEERVHFLGTQTEILSLLSAADVAVQSSNWEGFGLAAVEAMAVGLPVIASDVDGLRQVVEEAGMLFPRGDEKELAECVMSLYGNSALYNELSDKCMRRAQQYDIAIMAKKYIKIYEELVVTN